MAVPQLLQDCTLPAAGKVMVPVPLPDLPQAVSADSPIQKSTRSIRVNSVRMTLTPSVNSMFFGKCHST
jgi:hypothetical protein